MATTEIIYRGNNARYYTAAGLADCMAYGSNVPTSYTEVEATRYTVTFRLMDSAAGTLFSPLGSATSASGISRWEDGTQAKYFSRDNAAAEIVVPVYRVNGTAVLVYGAHPSHPGMSGFYSYSSARVIFQPASAAKYAFNGAYTVRGDDLAHVAPNLASGTEYNASKIVYSNANKIIYVGASAAPADSTFYVYAGYYWFLCLSQNNVTLVTSANSHTRTVANGKKYASILDIPDYNSGSNTSLTIKTSTGSLTFPYKQVLRRGLGSFLAGSNTRILTAFEGVDSANNTAVVLSGANTKADGSGIQVSVGDDIADLLTRNPSLVDYDTRGQLYASWLHRVAVTVDADGGTGGASAFYYCPENAAFYADAALSQSLAAIPVPTKASSALVGLYDGTTKAVDANGQIVDGWTPAADTTLTAHWREVKDVAFDKGDGAGGDDGVVYDSEAGGFCRRGTETVITAVNTPRLECWQFLGYYSASSGGTQLVAADGEILPAFVALGTSAPSTIYAQWQRVSYRLDVNAQGGEGGGPIYCDGTTAAFFSDDLLTNELESYPVPERPGYDFLGCFTAASGGELRIAADGDFDDLPVFATDGGTIFAQWQARTFTLAFDYAGGDGATEEKSVTYGEAVGTLPTPTTGPTADAVFEGWTIDGIPFDAATIWQRETDATARAKWRTNFSNVEDFFNLASPSLVPVASNSGDQYHRVAVSHGGRYEAGVTATGGIWRNPSVTYRVIRDTTVFVKLGQGYAATFTGTGASRRMAVSGYMITSVEINTEVGAFPTVTVTAEANEGANSVNNFAVNANRFNVAVPVRARSKAQNLLDAVSGGGPLQRCSLVATCDAVVVEDNLMPCASDIVDGRYELSAETVAPNGEAAPTMASGFALVGVPKQENDGGYIHYTVDARKEMT
ncbi:MAG: InlB B-repeat-containing protein [Kiritimatiellae bacterium]|nr:InlB B-repeat-containing protein [Kiritimatiellia bacterium]